MAHFAELDENNVVVSVTVVDNSHVPSDKHVDGETWCKNFFKKPDTTFKQTSYNAKFRKQYPLAAERLDKLEKNSHPCKELHEFDAYPKLISRIEELEKNIKK